MQNIKADSVSRCYPIPEETKECEPITLSELIVAPMTWRCRHLAYKCMEANSSDYSYE